MISRVASMAEAEIVARIAAILYRRDGLYFASIAF